MFTLIVSNTHSYSYLIAALGEMTIIGFREGHFLYFTMIMIVSLY